MHDGVVETTDLREGALALAMADDRPSSDALVTNDQPDEPWKKDAKDALPNAETPLAPTDAGSSLSRVGASASAESGGAGELTAAEWGTASSVGFCAIPSPRATGAHFSIAD